MLKQIFRREEAKEKTEINLKNIFEKNIDLMLKNFQKKLESSINKGEYRLDLSFLNVPTDIRKELQEKVAKILKEEYGYNTSIPKGIYDYIVVVSWK